MEIRKMIDMIAVKELIDITEVDDKEIRCRLIAQWLQCHFDI